MPVSAEGRVEHQNESKRWVRFGVQLDYSCRLKSAPSNVENRVAMISAIHKGVEIFCKSFKNEIMVISWKIVIYLQSSPGGTIVRTRFSPSNGVLFNRHE